MPLNTDYMLGSLTDPSMYPGDSQEDFNLDLILGHDQKLLLKYVREHVGKHTLVDLLIDLRESDSVFWQKVLNAIITYYHLENLSVYISDTPLENLYSPVSQLLLDLKVDLLNDITDKKIVRDFSIEDFQNQISTYSSSLLKWSLNFITKEDFDKFVNVIFSEESSPIYFEGDDYIY